MQVTHGNKAVPADISVSNNKMQTEVKAEPGNHTVFIRVKEDQYDAWMAVDSVLENKTVIAGRISTGKNTIHKFEALDISQYFNSAIMELHTLEYRTPRPKGYSIGARLNGRYAWDWNQGGHNAVKVDDTALRRAAPAKQIRNPNLSSCMHRQISKSDVSRVATTSLTRNNKKLKSIIDKLEEGRGVFYSPSGIGFSTPAKGSNVACASIWDNFPTSIEIPLKGKASELAVFFIGVTNPMQSRVENARFTVTYLDGSTETVSLVNPDNFDDWLNAALQTQNETVYFSDYNHGMVQRIELDPKKELAKLSMEAVANEVIIGLLGISVRM